MISNSRLVSNDPPTFLVLESAQFSLIGDFLWNGKDIATDEHSGSAFYGYEEQEDGELLYLGYVVVCDASSDAEEPDISKLTVDNVQEVDSYLREQISQQFEIIDWFDGQLNQSDDGLQALVNPYKVLDDGEIYQCVACRMSHNSKKWVVMCSFVPDRAKDFGSAVWGALKSITFKKD